MDWTQIFVLCSFWNSTNIMLWNYRKLCEHRKREVNEGIYPQIRNFKQIWKTKWDRSVLIGEMELQLQFSEIAA